MNVESGVAMAPCVRKHCREEGRCPSFLLLLGLDDHQGTNKLSAGVCSEPLVCYWPGQDHVRAQKEVKFRYTVTVLEKREGNTCTLEYRPGCNTILIKKDRDWSEKAWCPSVNDTSSKFLANQKLLSDQVQERFKNDFCSWEYILQLSVSVSLLSSFPLCFFVLHFIFCGAFVVREDHKVSSITWEGRISFLFLGLWVNIVAFIVQFMIQFEGRIQPTIQTGSSQNPMEVYSMVFTPRKSYRGLFNGAYSQFLGLHSQSFSKIWSFAHRRRGASRGGGH